MELQSMSLWAFWLFLLLSSMHVLRFFGSAANFSNETDYLALLHFKHLTTEDPLNSLSSWNHTLHFCHWQGVTCGGRLHPQRVTALNLTGQKLVGPISPFIRNLTFLRRIELANNSFNGRIPEEMGQLLRLRFLGLDDNKFTGEIPANLTRCSELQLLYLVRNQLIGSIPTELGSLSKLTVLALGINNLIENIPPSLGNLSSLTLLLSRNRLEGNIPDDLSQLVRLNILGIRENELSLLFGVNQFTRPIPVSLSNASGLALVNLNNNSFSGSVPLDFGNLKNLSRLRLWGNELAIGKGSDLGFLDSLINCISLQLPDVGINNLSGLLPNSIGNLSTQLNELSLDNNMIFGSIPSGIRNLICLTVVNLGYNFLTGRIPIGVGMLNKVEQLEQ
ncbi:putative receptor-like protein kinase At3g47110 [Magnolia sinica]|uniref:putative receptor-like protein kinase At3g47110 n=1 Tax=Magnolia sinica TaxID=86752 RepID=UPI00265A96EF|nr:putative receptor-like protein kinase At3g47110 [Magnolia sinica]